jgi:hypothetical protein
MLFGMLKTMGKQYGSTEITSERAHVKTHIGLNGRELLILIRNNKVIGYLPSQLNLCTHGKR